MSVFGGSPKKNTDQRGIVSITIAMVFIIVTLLIVTGFAQIARRNSRVALDSQLGQQAFYAAESGINDAIAKLQSGGTIVDQTDCLGSGVNSYTVNGGQISTDVSYTCQLVDLAPDSLSYDSVSDTSIVAPVEVSSGTLNVIEVTWKKTQGAPTAANASGCTVGIGTWPAVSSWPANCYYGVLRLDVLPVTDTTMLNADTAAAATATAFVYPSNNGGTAIFPYTNGGSNRYGGNANQGAVLRTVCDATECGVQISSLAYTKAYFRVSLLYRSSQNVQIDQVGGGGTQFENAQAIVDVTGKAQDVLRRVQVRVPIAGGRGSAANGFAEYALQSNESLCKRYYASPNAVTQPVDGCGY